VIVGRGKAVEGEEHGLEEGAPLLVEAGETHEIQNGGNRPLETLSFYAAGLLDWYSRRSFGLRGHEPINIG
jgi:mannose-6-phosphate isomerase-like protein (cupin superfamily)